MHLKSKRSVSLVGSNQLNKISEEKNLTNKQASFILGVIAVVSLSKEQKYTGSRISQTMRSLQ